MVGLLMVALTSGCGDTRAIVDPDTAGAEDDGGAYFFERIRFVAEHLRPDVVGQPSTLLEALPCNQAERSDLIPTSTVVRATVISVKPGTGTIWSDDEKGPEDSVVSTDVDDPDAEGRDVVIAFDVSRSMSAPGIELPQGTVEARMGVLAGADLDQFIASLESIDEALVLLSSIPDGAHQGQFYPALGGAGVGLVDSSDTVSFPGLGERSARFLDGVDTVDSAFASCPEPR